MLGILRQIQGWAKIKGGSDGTFIGNVGDQIKTRSNFGPESLTAFGRLKAALPTVIYEASFVENARNDLFDTSTASGASITYDATEKTRNLNVTTTSGSTAILQSFQRIKYTPGQQNAVIFVNQFEPKVNVTQCANYGDSDDGLFFRMTGLTFEVGIRSSATGSVIESVISQNNFNGDKLDGTGESGITADFTKPIIFFTQFQWLGAGSVYFWAAIEDKIVLMHREDHSGIITNTKYMRSATLPVRYKIENTATTSSPSTLKVSCVSSISEGTTQSPAVQRFVYNDTEKNLPNGGAFSPLVAIRLKSTADVANLKPVKFGLLGVTADSLSAELVVGGSLTGGSWVSVDADSAAEVNLTATGHSGGIVIDGDLSAQQISQSIRTRGNITQIGKFINGTSQILVLRARTLNNNADAFGSLTFEELY